MMALVDRVLALVIVIQRAALHIHFAKAAIVAEVVEIAAPTGIQVASA